MKVAIVMGSDSDEAVMRGAAEALDELGVGWEMRVLSAHRTPEDTMAYARGAAEPGDGRRSSRVPAVRRISPGSSPQ